MWDNTITPFTLLISTFVLQFSFAQFPDEQAGPALSLSYFEQQLRPDNAKGTPYARRGERLEGYVRQNISKNVPTDFDAKLIPVSLVHQFERFSREDTEWVVRWPRVAHGKVWLHAELQHDRSYRMDAFPTAASGEFRWPLECLRTENLNSQDLKLKVCLLGKDRWVKPLEGQSLSYAVPAWFASEDAPVLLPVATEAASGEGGTPTLKLMLRADSMIDTLTCSLTHYRRDGERKSWHRVREIVDEGQIYPGEIVSISLLTRKQPSLSAGYYRMKIRFESDSADDPSSTHVSFLLPRALALLNGTAPVGEASSHDSP